jgi:uncharacterized protein (TIGR02246 family)
LRLGISSRESQCCLTLPEIDSRKTMDQIKSDCASGGAVRSGGECAIGERRVSAIDRPETAPDAFQSAWNAHDMTAFASLFHDDATFVNRFAHHVRGVSEIVALHRPIHETIYRDSTLDNELIDVTMLGGDVAVVHFWSRLRIGPAHPAGAHDVDTLILTVLTRRDRDWRIQALENVTLTNPRTGEPVLRSRGSGAHSPP